MLLLTNPRLCPQCSKATVRFSQHKCINPECLTPLFKADDNYGQFQSDTNIRAFWVYFDPARKGLFRGFVHSDHLEAPAPRVEPSKLAKPKPTLPVHSRD